VPDENPSALGAFEFPLRFPGQYADKETNLYYNYFRDYDSLIGRYVESDPIGIGGGLNTKMRRTIAWRYPLPSSIKRR
jgi:RHS repeat-associated protein